MRPILEKAHRDRKRDGSDLQVASHDFINMVTFESTAENGSSAPNLMMVLQLNPGSLSLTD